MNDVIRTPKEMDDMGIDFEVIPRSRFTKEELERMDALTVAFFKAHRAEKALVAAQKAALEATADYARLRAFDEIAHAQTTPRRSRRATMRRSA